MPAVAPLAAPGRLETVEHLPACYGEIVAGLLEAQRMLALSSIASEADSYYLFRTTEVKSRAFLSVTEDRRVLFFFRHPGSEDVVLELDIGFSVAPVMEPNATDNGTVPAVTSILAIQPPFFGDDIPNSNKALLAAALDEPDLKKIAFVDLGLFFLGVTHPEDVNSARVAYMWHGSAAAEIVFPTSRPGSPITYKPEPFTMLLDEVARWARSGFKTGELWPIQLEQNSPEAIPQILQALVSGWTSARRAAMRRADDPIRVLLPDLEVGNYRASITLRLQPSGQLAVKSKDDNFRLAMSVEAGAGQIKLTVGPPDFLVSGDLRAKIMEAVLTGGIIRKWAEGAKLDQTFGEFDSFIRAAAPQALIFRGKKRGFTDTEIFVFEGDWAGKTRKVIAAVDLKVQKIDGEFQVDADEGSARVVHLTDPPKGFAHRIEFPEFLLSLINQLRNWENSFE